MNEANNQRITSPQGPGPRRGVIALAAAAAIAVLALVAVILGVRGGQQAAAPTATATATATSSATTAATATSTSSTPATTSPAASSTYQSPLGYSVQLQSPWRRSDLQSRTTPNPQGDPDLLGVETFTTRTPADEQTAMRASDTGVGPAQIYTASVALFRNSRNETAMAFAQRVKGGSGLVAVSVDPTTVDGRPGVKTTFKFTTSDTQTFYTLYVQDGDRIWAIGYTLAQSGTQIPAGATEPGVRGIVESFKFAR